VGVTETSARPPIPAGLQLIGAVLVATVALAVAGAGGVVGTLLAVAVMVAAGWAGFSALIRLAEELDDGETDYADPVDHWGVGGWPAPAARDLGPTRAERRKFVADVEAFVAEQGRDDTP
jgi:hypothetical protein